MRIEREPAVHGEVGSDAPPADDRVSNAFSAATEHTAFAERQVIGQVAVEKARHIGDASSVVAFGVVSVLEEEAEACLADCSRKLLFVAKRSKVPKAVGHALGPRVIGLEL